MIAEIREQLRTLDQSQKALRTYAFITTGALAVLGALLFFLSKKPHWGLWLWGIGGAFLLVGLVAPVVLKPVHYVWMALTFLLGAIMTTLLLTLLFFLVVTPIGLLVRRVKGDLLNQKIDRSAASYWVKREPREFDPQRYERLF